MWLNFMNDENQFSKAIKNLCKICIAELTDWKYEYYWLIESITDEIKVQFPKQRFLYYVARKNKKIKTMKKRRKTSSYKIKLSFDSKFCELSILSDSFEFQVERKTIT